ncbi:MAG: hypothetical protein GF334_08060, partial [Candidatus Altiarchaeales archaeon]|nr:hypothetical protein [Candidatus Altiarchaeales archaeon]
MARSFSYQETEEGGIKFTTHRKIGDVRIPNYVYDMWMPIVGSDALGVYAVYCRLEMKGEVKKITMATLAKACRIGVKKLNTINEKLEECGFVKITKPTGAARLMHWTTTIEIFDPPYEVSPDLIDKYCNDDYELLTPWFKSQKASSEKSKGDSGKAKGHLDEKPKGNSNIAAFGLQPLDIASATQAQNSSTEKSAVDAQFDELFPRDEQPPQQQQPDDLSMLLGANGGYKEVSAAQAEFDRSGWQIYKQEVAQGIVAFMEATGFGVPQTDSLRKLW